MNTLEYLIYCIPVIFIVVSRMYKLKSERLRDTGKIPNIICAKQRQLLFVLLAVLSTLIILVITQFQFFEQVFSQQDYYQGP